jgi:hypothetical protein
VQPYLSNTIPSEVNTVVYSYGRKKCLPVQGIHSVQTFLALQTVTKDRLTSVMALPGPTYLSSEPASVSLQNTEE